MEKRKPRLYIYPLYTEYIPSFLLQDFEIVDNDEDADVALAPHETAAHNTLLILPKGKLQRGQWQIVAPSPSQALARLRQNIPVDLMAYKSTEVTFEPHREQLVFKGEKHKLTNGRVQRALALLLDSEKPVSREELWRFMAQDNYFTDSEVSQVNVYLSMLREYMSDALVTTTIAGKPHYQLSF